jgi:serine/threonine protein kinase
MSLERITDIFLGKRTTAFLHPGAAKAEPKCCFSFVSKAMTLNLETQSRAQRVNWLNGIQILLDFYGNQTYNPPSASGSARPLSPGSTPFSPPASVVPGGITPGAVTPIASPPAGPAPGLVAAVIAKTKEDPRQRRGSADLTLSLPAEVSADPSLKAKQKGISDEDPLKVFELLSKIGEGAYGSVYKARDTRSNELVAIKILKLDRKSINSLRTEILVLQDCDSNFIVAYKGTFRKNNNVWIVMEWCDSGSLSDMIEECRTTLTEEQIASVMRMALMGLDFLHCHKKIHRDLKAANILVTTGGECKLADFGVSAEMKNTLAHKQTAIGTPHWMAPEVIETDKKYNTKADIWSLGITAYELAVGDPPHANANQMRAIFLIPSAPAPKLPNPERWSKSFQHFISVCLQKVPDNRPDAQTLLTKHPFLMHGRIERDKAIVAEFVRQCNLKRAHLKQNNLRSLTTRLQTERDPGGEPGEAQSDTILRRPTQLQQHEPDFSAMDDGRQDDDESLFQIIYS